MTERPYRKNVAIIIINDAGQVLAGERGDLQGVWQIPQGGVDPGENERQAMLRELQEEVGTTEVEILAESPRRYRYDFPDWLAESAIAKEFRGQEQRYYVVRMWREGLPDPQKTDSEFRSFQWMSAEDLLEQIVDFKQEVYRLAFQDLAEHIRPNPAL